MKRPNFIQFAGDSLEILRDSILDVAPEEGCALLLGDQMESTGVEIVDSKDPKAIEKSLNRLKNRSYDKNSMPDKGEFIGE